MNEAAKQATLSAIRTILAIVGGAAVSHGYTNEATVSELIGAVMVLIPLAWGIWNQLHAEKKTQAREVLAVNAGIKVADSTPGATPLVSAAEAPAVIKEFAPSNATPEVKPEKGNSP